MGDIRLSHRTTPVFAKAPAGAMPPRRAEPPLPPLWVSPIPKGIEDTPLSQFVLLSLLLHVMFILMFGAPSGGSREGRAMWGSMQVLLTAPPRAPEPILKLDRAPVLPVAPAPRPLDPSVAREIERTAAPPVRPAEPLAFPPLLDRIVTPEPKLQMSPALQLPLPQEGVAQPPPAPVETIRAEPAPAAAPPEPIQGLAPLVAPAPVVLPTPLETPALPAISATPPVERPPVEVPAIPVPTETLAPVAPAQVRDFDRIEPQLPPPVLRSPPASRVEPPARVEPAPALPAEPAPALRPEPARAAPPGPARADPDLPAPSPFRAPPAARDANQYDPTAPSIDLDAVRNRAGQLGRQGTGNRAALPFPMPPVPERKTKMETAIENARKPDCRTAYQSLGLAAIVPLIANEFGDGKCRW